MEELKSCIFIGIIALVVLSAIGFGLSLEEKVILPVSVNVSNSTQDIVFNPILTSNLNWTYMLDGVNVSSCVKQIQDKDVEIEDLGRRVAVLKAELYYGTSFERYQEQVEFYEDYNDEMVSHHYRTTEYQSKVLKVKAAELRGATIEDTVDNVREYLYGINYSFSNRPIGDDETLEDMTGDCTDISSLGQALLQINGIHTKEVYGYSYEENSTKGLKHDWAEVLYPDKETGQLYWMVFDSYFYFPKLEKESEGQW